MTILLDHVIVPAHDQDASARFLGQLLGVPWEEGGHFSPVYVNETLTLDFGNRERFEPQHYCFHVSDEEFEEIFGRIRAAGLKYRSEPGGPDDMDITPDGKELWVTQRFLRRIAVVDLEQMRMVASIPVGKSPHGLFMLKSGNAATGPLRAASTAEDKK